MPSDARNDPARACGRTRQPLRSPGTMNVRPQLKDRGSVAISFSANLRFVRPVRHFISALCTLAEYGEDETEAIALVATEMLNNAIEHGASNSDEEIDVIMQVRAEVFRIEVVDPGRGGPGFARTAVEQASQIPDLEEPRGRGLFLIKNYMDELDISYDPKRGTRLVVSKAIAS
jgi:anti-sigma regulatory factor (Ser/Thr protein kinase)